MRPDTSVHADALARLQPFVGTTWRHRKGGTYAVILFAVREQDRSLDVVYRDLAADVIYTRPAREFFDGRFMPLGGVGVAAW